MLTKANNKKDNSRRSIAGALAQMQAVGESTSRFADNRPEAVTQRKMQVMADGSSQVARQRALQETANNSPQVKQAAQLQSIANNKQPEPIERKQRGGAGVKPLHASRAVTRQPAVVQRLLMTHETKNDEGVFIDSTGDVGFINIYAKELAVDSAVLVDGQPKGKAGLLNTLKEAEVDGSAIQDKLANSLMDSNSWNPSNNNYKKELATYVLENAYSMGSGDISGTFNDYEDDYDKLMTEYEFAKDSSGEIKDWIKKKADLGEATTVGNVAAKAGNMPIEWHDDLAYIVYEATRGKYVDIQKPAYVAPFIALIKDINDGKITEFHFEEKYGSEAQGTLGAEFNVEEPDNLKDKYVGKAVLHTHYAAKNENPNFGHTKPEDKKFARGFGYTVVDTTEVNAVDDSKKKYNNL